MMIKIKRKIKMKNFTLYIHEWTNKCIDSMVMKKIFIQIALKQQI